METVPSPIQSTPTSPTLYDQNHQGILEALRKAEEATAEGAFSRSLTLTIERFVHDLLHHRIVGFKDDEQSLGVETLLRALAATLKATHIQQEAGHVLGCYATLHTSCGELGIHVRVEAGAQLVCSLGPSSSLKALHEGLTAFDQQFHLCARELGMTVELLAQGYNPYARTPLDASLVPQTRFTLLSAHFARTGHYARDMMRCEAATTLHMSYANERDALSCLRLSSYLAPLVCFLCDNTGVFRTQEGEHTPRMVRSLIWDDIDTERCGLVPNLFHAGFSFDSYATWIQSLPPVLMEQANTQTLSFGKASGQAVFSQQLYTFQQLASLLTNVFPYARFNQGVELHAADSLQPRFALAYAAFIKGLFFDDYTLDAALDLFGHAHASSVQEAESTLRLSGWHAQVYNKSVAQLVQELIDLAQASLSLDERNLFDELALLWEVHMVPRDALLWKSQHSD